jgi:hypothetical protein
VNKWSVIGLVVGILAAVLALVLPKMLRNSMMPSITIPTAPAPPASTGSTPPTGAPAATDSTPSLSALSKADWSAWLGKFDGRFEASGAGGTWVLEQGFCYSGERDGFFGVRLKTNKDDGLSVKLVKDPVKGWAVVANEPDGCKSTSTGECSARLYEAADCSTLDIKLHADMRWQSPFFDGTVSIDCKYRGARIVGKAKIERCGRG